MTRWSALLATAAAAASTLAWAPSAAAAECSGVTVVVDFGSAGGGVGIGCAAGDPSSGLGALSGAGHGYEFAPRQPGLVCRIDSRPSTCSTSTQAYWSYWHAEPGGSWVYSTLGGGARDPKPGTVDGWAFGAGSPPSVAPPAPKPAPKPPAPKPPAPKPPAQPTTVKPTTAPPTSTTARPTRTTSGNPIATTTTPPSVATTSTSTPAHSQALRNGGLTATSEEEDGGGPLPFLIGSGVVVLLGALAFGTARRRAKADP